MATDWVTAYWRAIESGEVMACKKATAIYRRLADEIAHDGGGRWVFSATAGNKPIEFAERFCVQSKGRWAGKPLRLELWQKAFVCALFGFVDRETGERRFIEALLCVPRKMGKSTLAAAILLYLFVCEGQADVFTAATKHDQAALIFEEALAMVRASAFLSKRIRKRQADMWIEATNSRFKALSRNSNSMDGLLAKAVCVDELHGLEGRNGRNLYEVLKQSQSATSSPVFLMTTTSGTVRHGVYDDIYGLASDILDGTIAGGAADRFLPVVYELDDPEWWHDIPVGPDGRNAKGEMSKWYGCSPGLEPQGKIKSLDFLVGEAQRAEANSVDVPGLLTKDFNVPQSGAGSWLQYADIVNHAKFDLKDCAGKWAIGGVDLSKAGDLTCATLLMRGEGDELLAHQCYWLPEDKVEEHVRGDKIPYDRWHDLGLVRYCEGGVIRTEDITRWFLEMVQDMDISIFAIYFDAWSATAWVDEMRRLGFRMVPCHQGARTLSLPMEHMEDLLLNHKINYNDSPILLWCLTSCTYRTDANGMRALDKDMGRKRIDGAASLLDAIVGYIDNPDFSEL